MSNSDVTITCPNCRESFPLTGALVKPLLDAESSRLHAEAHRFVENERAKVEAAAKAGAEAQFAEERKAMQGAMQERDEQVQTAKVAELAARKAKSEADAAKQDIELAVARKVEEARTQITQQAVEQATADVAAKLEAAQFSLAAKDAKLQQAQAAEVEALRLKAEAEEAKREVELRVTRELDAERAKIRESAVKERDNEHRLELADKDKKIQAMIEQVEELRRKGTAGSQQMAGEVLELDLEAILRNAFPQDRFDPVPKGQNGADLVQTVMSATGAPSGKILWECKRTKAWNKAWLPKLRDDQRAVNASLAVIATETLPDDVPTFGCVDDVWVTGLKTTIPVATALRVGLLETARARRASSIDGSTKDRVFGYLMGTQFRQRVTQAVEAQGEMLDDLNAEKRATERMWSKREKQLSRVLGSVSGLYGDLQGLVGSNMPALEKLELPGIDQAAENPQCGAIATPQLPQLPAAGDGAGVN